ncbi:hypothetical protein CsSME_00051554 [Camellia sinensis var. sinensis]
MWPSGYDTWHSHVAFGATPIEDPMDKDWWQHQITSAVNRFGMQVIIGCPDILMRHLAHCVATH